MRLILFFFNRCKLPDYIFITLASTDLIFYKGTMGKRLIMDSIALFFFINLQMKIWAALNKQKAKKKNNIQQVNSKFQGLI